MPITDPVTVEDHRACYQEHRARADELKVQIDLGLINGLDPDKHRDMVTELHDELCCACHHYTAARLVALATGQVQP
jgi:hypothetical protein